jgi:hypothetical protein
LGDMALMLVQVSGQQTYFMSPCWSRYC